MVSPAKNSLAAPLAAELASLLRAGGYARGDHLSERALAARLRVSRSPVRAAFRLLRKAGLVEERPGGGYAVGRINAPLKALPKQDSDAFYFKLARDRLDGLLPERISENELLRRYKVSRAELTRLLRLATGEGWMERLPGHGWSFLPVITSLEAYRETYRFRLTIEPAAILEPGFVLDVPALTARRREQQAMMEGGIKTASDAEIFAWNSGLHETIVACSTNLFFLESLKRINRLRRLMEYRQKLDRKAAIARCREHIALIDLLLAGKNSQAAAMLRAHLASVGGAKSGPKD